MSNPVPEGWCETTVGELTKGDALFSDGDWVESKDQDPAGGNRLIQLADIGDGRFINKSSRYMNDEQFERLGCTALEKGDILIARMPDPLGRACIYPLDNVRAATVVDVAIIRTSNANHYWLMSAINSSSFRHQIDLNASGTTRTRIARGALTKIKLVAPPLPEQQKIADILTSVDNVIESTQAQINKLQDLKTGMMQELLTRGIGHSEFKDSPVGRIPVGWEVKPLGDVAEFINGNSFKASDWRESGLPIIRIQNLNGNMDFNYFDGEVNDKWFVETNTLLFAWSGQRGKSFGARIWKGQPGVLNQHIFKVLPVDEGIQKEFLLLKLLQVQVDIERHAHGFKDSFMHVKKSDLTVQEVAIPPLDEQAKIISVVGSISDKLALTESKLEQLKSTKKALMQDLLTGTVRVKTD